MPWMMLRHVLQLWMLLALSHFDLCQTASSPPATGPTISFPDFSIPPLPAFPSLPELRTNVQVALPELWTNVQQTIDRMDIKSVMETANKGGVTGVVRRMMGLDKREENLSVAWDAVGSVPEKSAAVYGYSEQARIHKGSLVKQAEFDNYELCSKVLEAFSMTGWNEISEKDGIRVYKRGGKDVSLGNYPPGVGAADSDSSKLLCLFSRGEIDAPISKVYELFLSNDYVQHYNPMCQECLDVGWLDEATKITWASSRRIGPIFPRDFVTRCHYRQLRDGALLIAQMSEQLDCQQFRDQGLSAGKYCRMEVILAGYLLRSLDGGTKTEFNMLSLSNPGGVFDTKIGATVANMVAATGPINFITAVRKLAQK